MTEKVIELVNVSKSYFEGDQRHDILRGTNAVFFGGDRVAILGKSGSGKSTLLNIISGIDRIDDGQIIVKEREISSLSDQELTLLRRKEIGFVFQFFNLIPTLTVWENIQLPSELNGIDRKLASSNVERMLLDVGLRDRADAYPDRLSGGEQQRVAIARALAHNPAILLADEPTGNLDEENGKKILNLLETLTNGSGKTLILVTHSNEAARIANRQFYLHDCQLTEGGAGTL